MKPLEVFSARHSEAAHFAAEESASAFSSTVAKALLEFGWYYIE
jgi:hypothetical protein